MIKRYFVYERRNEKEFWADWSQYREKDEAINQSKIINDIGWQSKIYDRLNKEILQ